VSSTTRTDRRCTVAQRDAFRRGKCNRNDVGRDRRDPVAVARDAGAGAIRLALS